jgi:hypothetical protein
MGKRKPKNPQGAHMAGKGEFLTDNLPIFISLESFFKKI